jgi:hypothetical protein
VRFLGGEPLLVCGADAADEALFVVKTSPTSAAESGQPSPSSSAANTGANSGNSQSG